MNAEFSTLDELRDAFVPRSEYGDGEWMDLAGMIAPCKAVDDILADVESGKTAELDVFNRRIAALHDEYYHYEWRWACKAMEEYYGLRLAESSASELSKLICRWRESVVTLDRLLYEEELRRKILFIQQMFNGLGVPLLTDEIVQDAFTLFTVLKKK